MLNRLWYSLFCIGFVSAFYQWLVLDSPQIFSEIMVSLFEMAGLSVDIAIGLVGVMCLWLGLFRLAEKAGLIKHLSKGLEPLFAHLMPEIPRGHPAHASVTMNLAANMLGLDNAATPLGLKAMGDLQTLNPNKEQASNAQILFLVLNTSSVTLFPVTIFLYRAQMGAADPSVVFLPILMATTVSTIVGLLSVAWIQKINLFNRTVLSYGMGFSLLLSLLVYACLSMDSSALAEFSSLSGNLILFSVVMFFISFAFWKNVDVYSEFVEGAKEGFQISINLIPYLLAMLVAIGVLRASGALDLFLQLLTLGVDQTGLNSEFIAALPTALMKPFSGSGARAMMLETMDNYGVDSFPALLSCIVQGSTETTFYVIAVYFGSVGIKNVRHAILCGLLADFAGIVAAILLGYWFFYPVVGVP
ncbi:MAG: hypothetical protein COB04_06200 [Gammaproteobacteria bacterium]|nr:MAG: hypothetical protein COB04_06200 [Gammaproteobacteria bacterium]